MYPFIDILSKFSRLLHNLASDLTNETKTGPPGTTGGGKEIRRPPCEYDLDSRIVTCSSGRPAKLSKTFMNLFVRLLNAPDQIVHFLDTLADDACAEQPYIWLDESDMTWSSRRCVACRLSKVLRHHGIPYRVRYSEVSHTFELIYLEQPPDPTATTTRKSATSPPELHELLQFLAGLLQKNAVVRFCEECVILLRVLMSRQDGKAVPER